MIPIKNNGSLFVDTYPNKCPHCHQSITPNQIHYNSVDILLEVYFACPNHACKKSFIGYYNNQNRGQYFFDGRTSIGNLITRSFSQSISNNFPSFVLIYNQAYSAEQYNLTEICGVGYRKALEFLIKDYTIQKNANKKDEIEKMALSQCIGTYVSDENIKSVSKRAVWLGNDETHYIRKWDTKDLKDLKKLIDLTLHWIEAEILTASFTDEMPD